MVQIEHNGENEETENTFINLHRVKRKRLKFMILNKTSLPLVVMNIMAVIIGNSPGKSSRFSIATSGREATDSLNGQPYRNRKSIGLKYGIIETQYSF